MIINVKRNDIIQHLTDMINLNVKLPQIWKRQVKPLYIAYQRERFETQNAKNGGWKKLAPSTVAFKNRYRPWTATTPLIFTGNLFRSMIGDTKAGYRELTEDKKITVMSTASPEDSKQKALSPRSRKKKGSTASKYSLAAIHDKTRSLTQYDDAFINQIKGIIVKAVRQ